MIRKKFKQTGMRVVFNVSEESRYSREYFTTQDMEQFCFPAWSRKDILLLGKSKSKKKRKKKKKSRPGEMTTKLPQGAES